MLFRQLSVIGRRQIIFLDLTPLKLNVCALKIYTAVRLKNG